MMHQVYNTLPDDRPITAIGIVSDPEKCPPGYVVVSRTHDQDSDADLWKEGFFGRRTTRYICLSKTEGVGGTQLGGGGPPPPPATDYIVQSVIVINDKEIPPDGYSLLPRTIDSEQKAWRKRQLCYRLAKRNIATSAVTDIIVLSRSKKAPEGFTRAGEINGLTLCYKVSNVNHAMRQQQPNPDADGSIPILAYGLHNTKGPAASPPTTSASNGFGPLHSAESKSPSPPSLSGRQALYPSTSPLPTDSHEYEILSAAPRPTRPAPCPPLVPIRPPPPVPQISTHSITYANSKNYATFNAYQGLEGVPFILNPNFLEIADPQSLQLPAIKSRTKYQLDQEFNYDFRIERQT